MNRCAICGKFRRWEDLTFCWTQDLRDIYGTVEDIEWFECVFCRADVAVAV